MNSFRPLHDGWTLRSAPDRPAPPGTARPLPATVPGCVHTDLLAAGAIEDPYLDDNEVRQGWIGRTDWLYETAFEWTGPGAERVELACAGLDTVATVTLNGVELGHARNMHRSYRFDALGALRPGQNRLAVRFDSAYRYAEAVRDALGARPAAYAEPYQYIRKMACNFGWDWGPTLVTAGIWQPIGLHSWSDARLAEVCPVVTVDGRAGRVEVRATVARAAGGPGHPLTLTATVAGQEATATVAPGQHTARLVLGVTDPARWWPRGYGDPRRYELEVTLSLDGSVVDTWRRWIGFRSVRLDTAPDRDGSAFRLIVNDTPVFVRGANWIPDDVFVSRVDRRRYAERLGQAGAAGVNYLRVWGGGRYEAEEFYDLADGLGIMIGQDFLFSCAAYPEEEPLGSEVAAEAREQVTRLAPHPSLVLWTGNNEAIWGFHDWGWPDTLDGRSWGLGYYLDVLPSILAEVDPSRPYWPGSPYSGGSTLHPNDPRHGTTHVWDVWNTHDYTHYRSYRPRFVAEFGFQAPPAYATLRRAVSDDPLTPDSPGVAHHQKAVDGNAKLLRGLTGHLPAPGNADDWHFATQLNQARAVAFGVEHFRSLRPLCGGTIVWQLNDCWPATSWSMVDGDGRRKPAWYALRRSYADRLLTFQPGRGVAGALALVAVNDGRMPWPVRLDVVRHTLAGEPRAKVTVGADVPPGQARAVSLPPEVSTPDDPAGELLVADWTEGRALWFFAEDVDVAYPEPDYRAEVTAGDGETLVTVTAGTLLRDLTLFPDRLDPAARVDQALVTLLPGESATLRVRGRGPLDPVALVSRPVLRCANDLSRQAARPGTAER